MREYRVTVIIDDHDERTEVSCTKVGIDPSWPLARCLTKVAECNPWDSVEGIAKAAAEVATRAPRRRVSGGES